MLRRRAVLVFSAIGFALAGCGGGGKAPMLPAAPAPTASSTASQSTKSKASFVITIPKATTSAGARRPAYVSPATQSMKIVVMQGSTTVSTQTVGLTTSSSGCSSSLASTTCTLTLPLNAGTYTASLTTYDGASGTGNQLSTAQNISFTVIADQNNFVQLTLSGIPAKIVAMPGNTANSVYVVAEDADGNVIVGSGSPTFSASPTSKVAVATITQPTATAPNTISIAAASPAVYGSETIGVTASYPSSQTNGCISQSDCVLVTPITVTNIDGTAFLALYDNDDLVGFSLPLGSNAQTASTILNGVAGSPYWGIATNSSGTVFGWGNNNGSLIVSAPPYTSVTTDSNVGLSSAYYYGAADSHGDVFIPNETTAGTWAIGIVSPPYTGAATELTDGINDSYGAAVDSNNNLYVANNGNNTVTVYASPYTSPSTTLTTTSAPLGVAVSGSTLFVTENGTIDVFNLTSSSTTPAETLDMTGYSNGAATVDASGNLWVGCFSGCAGTGGAVYEFTKPFATGNTPAVSLTSLSDGSSRVCQNVVGVRFDLTGNLYVDAAEGGANGDGCFLQYSGSITAGSTAAFHVTAVSSLNPWGMVMTPASFTVTP